MKLTVDTAYIKRYYKIPMLSKIDMTVDNKNAIVNSELIAKFAEKRELLSFCILVKLWAKNNNIING
jgi:DNA polymerase sigma